MDLRSFVSEAQLEERRKRRQEQWEKTRKEDDPLEAPEEEYDLRSLYERLEENKLKKQEEFEESRRLKNMVRGIDDDEASFLELVDQNKFKEEYLRHQEEQAAINELKTALNYLNEAEKHKRIEEFRKSIACKKSKNPKVSSKKLSNIVNIVKRKSSPEKDDQSKKYKQKSQNDSDSKNESATKVDIQTKSSLSLVNYSSDSGEED